MTSMRDLARLAGVSPSTVSRALKDHPGIPASTRERIKALAAEQHYLPAHLQARTLGCILPDVTCTFYARMLRGILEAGQQAGYQVIMLETHSLLTRTCEAIRTLAARHVEAVLIASEHPEPIPCAMTRLLRRQRIVPVSLDSTPFAEPVDSVATDETALAEQVIDYLIQLGHRSIAFMGMLPGGQKFSRARAMAEALRRRRLATVHFYDTQTTYYEGFDAQEALSHLLGLTAPPTALVTWEDRLAARLMQQAAAHRLRIPGDLSLIGCANMELAGLLIPPLTSVEQYPERLGQQAVALALARNATVTALSCPSDLIIRASCAPPRSPSPGGRLSPGADA